MASSLDLVDLLGHKFLTPTSLVVLAVTLAVLVLLVSDLYPTLCQIEYH